MTTPYRPDVMVCSAVVGALQDALKRLAQNKDPAGAGTIVDGVVQDVEQIRATAALMRAKAKSYEDQDDVRTAAAYWEIARKYDEMVVDAQVRLLDQHVKASNNEQMSRDRQMHIAANVGKRIGGPSEEDGESTRKTIAARSKLIQELAKDAEFTKGGG